MKYIDIFLQTTRETEEIVHKEYYQIKTKNDFYSEFSPFIDFLEKYKNIDVLCINTKQAKSELLKIGENYYIIIDQAQTFLIMEIIELFFISESYADILNYIKSFFNKRAKNKEKITQILNQLEKSINKRDELYNIGALDEYIGDFNLIKHILDHFVVFHEFGHLVTIYSNHFPTNSFKEFDMGEIIDITYDSLEQHYFISQNKNGLHDHFTCFSDKIKKDVSRQEFKEFFTKNREYLNIELGADLISLRMISRIFNNDLENADKDYIRFYTALFLISSSLSFYKRLYCILDYINDNSICNKQLENKLREYMFMEGVFLEIYLKNSAQFRQNLPKYHAISLNYYERFENISNSLENILNDIV